MESDLVTVINVSDEVHGWLNTKTKGRRGRGDGSSISKRMSLLSHFCTLRQSYTCIKYRGPQVTYIYHFLLLPNVLFMGNTVERPPCTSIPPSPGVPQGFLESLWIISILFLLWCPGGRGISFFSCLPLTFPALLNRSSVCRGNVQHV